MTQDGQESARGLAALHLPVIQDARALQWREIFAGAAGTIVLGKLPCIPLDRTK